MEETRRFVEYILIDGNGAFSDLFTANYSFINKTLADLYGVPAPATDWELYTFPASAKRQGILTHASFLKATGGHARDVNVIFRGKVVFEALFCNVMPPPPDDAADQNGAVTDRATHPSCRGCHAVVDPAGRMFDIYNDDGGLFPSSNAIGQILLDVDIAGDYSDAVAFSQAVAGSQAVTHCATRQLYRFALGRDAFADDTPSFLQVRDTLDNTGSLKETIKTFVMSDSFSKVHSPATDIQACMR